MTLKSFSSLKDMGSVKERLPIAEWAKGEIVF